MKRNTLYVKNTYRVPLSTLTLSIIEKVTVIRPDKEILLLRKPCKDVLDKYI